MNSLPPRSATWLRQQVQQEVERRMAPMRRELNAVDDWANGVFAALLDLLLPLLKAQPELAATLEAVWRRAAVQYERLELQQPEGAEDFHTTPERLEARKMLYWLLAQLGQWPGVPPKPQRRRKS